MVSVALKTIGIVVLFSTISLAGEQSDFEAIQKAYRLNNSNKQELVKNFSRLIPTATIFLISECLWLTELQQLMEALPSIINNQ